VTFLEAVTRIMRAEGILRGDTDAPTSFSDLQHGATISLAQIAIQDELNELVSDSLIPYEHAPDGSIVTIAGTRSYSLPTNFVQMFGRGVLYDATSNVLLYEFPGGEARLAVSYYDYKTAQSTPQYWYFDATTTKKIAFWPVPQGSVTYIFDYEKDVSVTNASDTMPFHNNMEAQAFCRLAARRFKLLYQGLDAAAIAADPERVAAKATVMSLITGKNPSSRYAPVYR
jgi:hypothetical protein